MTPDPRIEFATLVDRKIARVLLMAQDQPNRLFEDVLDRLCEWRARLESPSARSMLELIPDRRNP